MSILYIYNQRRVEMWVNKGHMPLMNQIKGEYAPSKYAPDEIQNSKYISASDRKSAHGGIGGRRKN